MRSSEVSLMRVLICGGRDVGRPPFIRATSSRDALADITRASEEISVLMENLDKIHDEIGINHIICGLSKGAANLALDWAEARNVPYTLFRSHRGFFRRESSISRNLRMLRDGKPDLCIAFDGAQQTEILIKNAVNMRIKVIRIKNNKRFDQ